MSLSSTEGLARASIRRPKLVVLAWVLGLAISAALSATLLNGVLTTEAGFTNNPESQKGGDLLRSGFGGEQRTGPRSPNETVIVRSTTLTVDDPAFKSFVEGLYRELLLLGPETVEGGITFLSGAPGLVSPDRHTTLIPIVLRQPTERVPRVLNVLEEHEGSGFDLYIVGVGSVDHAFNEMAEKDLSAEFRVGLPTALIVLLVVFGAVVAALMPVAVAFLAIVIATAVVAVIGQWFEFSFFVTNMIAMMGLAVGIDYALFIMSRYREERRKGVDKAEAIVNAAGTASRAVFFSGMTVVLALMGLLLIPTTIFRSLGAGAIIVVVIAVAAALTLLPALLGLLGDRVDSLRLPFRRRVQAANDDERGFWSATSRAVMARPWLSLAITGGLLLAATIPMTQMKTGGSGLSAMPESSRVKQGFNILQRDFNQGLGSSAEVVIGGDLRSLPVIEGVARLRSSLEQDGDFAATRASYRVNAKGDVGHLSVPLTGDPGTEATQDAVRRLRSQHIPQAFRGVPAQVYVTGGVAGNIDFFGITEQYTPIVFSFVLGLSFILLTVVFRSLVVPVKAILLNLLSVGAAYGLMVLVFQQGVGASLLGFSKVEVIEAWIPLFLFTVLFGLSMDYHVFLLSRIRERFDATGDNDAAVAFGLRTTAGIITGAALIMVAIFSGFASGELVMFQQVGFGLAVSVLLDATVVRSILVPASMKLLGRRNWYLPSFLQWLPQVRTESAPEREAKTPVQAG